MVAGGGLAGLSAGLALAGAGFEVEIFEARPYPGGRATSFPLAPWEPDSPAIDNCQHILLRCCVNLLDFYRRAGVEDCIVFHRRFHFVEPGGRVSVLERGPLPAPLHFTGAFARMRCLGWADKAGIARAILALRREAPRRTDLDRITMLDWLREKRQTPRAIARFWAQVLVSAINEDLDRMAAVHGFQVFRLGFLARGDSYEMGVPRVPLAGLYGAVARDRANLRLHLRCPVERLDGEGLTAGGRIHHADYYICALPPDRMDSVAPALGVDTSWVRYSPITGIHLWFDRPVTQLPHATLLDRTIQWMFNKDGGRYLQLVVSASRSLEQTPRAEIVDLARRELAEFFPAAGTARLERSHVIKEVRATFSASPGVEAFRPDAPTRRPDVFLAGDWTRSGWPATMEGAVRSGYRAAEAVTRAAGRPGSFLLTDIA
jgi:squalene-associated FAD-dependent desaturase